MSALEPNGPWVTHELLCDLIFGLPFSVFGLNWVVLASSVAIALAFVWSYQMARSRGSGLLPTLILMIVSMEACTVHWSARPHVFSYLLFLAAYYQCFIAATNLKKNCAILALIFFLWANLHGSFPLGLMMIGMRAVGDLWEGFIAKFAVVESQTKGFSDSDEAAETDTASYIDSSSANRWTLKEALAIVISCVVACCINVRGASFLTYVIEYLTNPKIQFHSDEWRSLDFSLGLPAWSFLILCFALLCVWVYAKNKPRIGEFLFLAALCCSSIYAMRLVPYFALAVIPAAAAQLANLQNSKTANSLPIVKSILATDKQASLAEKNSAKLSWVHLILVLAMSAAFLFVPAFKIADFDPTRLPVQATNYLQKHKVTGLGFTKDNWGAYLYWRLGESIFLDDKTDFYSQNLLDDYMTIFMTKPGWQQVLDKYKFAYILIPTGLPLQFDLEKMSGWKQVFSDPGSVLFVRAEDKGAQPQVQEEATPPKSEDLKHGR